MSQPNHFLLADLGTIGLCGCGGRCGNPGTCHASATVCQVEDAGDQDPIQSVPVSGASNGNGGSGATPVISSERRYCRDFTYQEDAQAAFVEGVKIIDGDKEGFVCEHLPHCKC